MTVLKTIIKPMYYAQLLIHFCYILALSISMQEVGTAGLFCMYFFSFYIHLPCDRWIKIMINWLCYSLLKSDAMVSLCSEWSVSGQSPPPSRLRRLFFPRSLRPWISSPFSLLPPISHVIEYWMNKAVSPCIGHSVQVWCLFGAYCFYSFKLRTDKLKN